MPEHDETPGGETPAREHRGPGRVSRSWARYGAHVRRHDSSLSRLLRHAVAQSVVCAGLFVIITTATSAAGGHTLDMVPVVPTDPGAARGTGEPLTPGQIRAIEEAEEEARRVEMIKALNVEHNCYTGENPAPGVDPRYAVVTLPGEDPTLVDAAVGYGIWLAGDPGQHHSFCP